MNDKIAVADQVCNHPIRPRLARAEASLIGVSMTRTGRKYTIDESQTEARRQRMTYARSFLQGKPSHNSNTPEDFWAFVNKTDGCWLWTGFVGTHGYGQFGVQWKRYRAHRYSWILVNGSIPNGLHVCHRCDTPLCVNPGHLFLGTNSDNVRDAMQKGRYRGFGVGNNLLCGDANLASKLSELKVKEIRALSASGVGPTELGTRYGVHKQTIMRVVRRVSWRHVD